MLPKRRRKLDLYSIVSDRAIAPVGIAIPTVIDKPWFGCVGKGYTSYRIRGRYFLAREGSLETRGPSIALLRAEVLHRHLGCVRELVGELGTSGIGDHTPGCICCRI